MKNLIKNYRTTSAGIIIIGGAIIHLAFQIKSGTADETAWTVSLGGVTAGLGLIFAGDAGASATPSDIQALHDKIDDLTTRIQTGGK